MHTQANIKVFVLFKGIKILPIINTRYHPYPQHHGITPNIQAGREKGDPPSTLGLPPATPSPKTPKTPKIHRTPTPPTAPHAIPRTQEPNHVIDSRIPIIPPHGYPQASPPHSHSTPRHPRKGSICTLRDNHPSSTPPTPTYHPGTPHPISLHEARTAPAITPRDHTKRGKEPHAVLHEQGKPGRTATPGTPSLLAPPKLPAAIRRAIQREIIHTTPHLAWIPSRINELFSTITRGKPS